MENMDLVTAVAERFVYRYGSNSLATIAAHCERATAIGDQLSLHTWQNIAVAVRQLQGAMQSPFLNSD